MRGLITKLKKIISIFSLGLIFLLNLASVGSAKTTVSAKIQYILNTFSFLVCGWQQVFIC